MMTRKHFIALADDIRYYNWKAHPQERFTEEHLEVLANFCAKQSMSFDRDKWLHYTGESLFPKEFSKQK